MECESSCVVKSISGPHTRGGGRWFSSFTSCFCFLDGRVRVMASKMEEAENLINIWSKEGTQMQMDRNNKIEWGHLSILTYWLAPL